MCLYFLHLDPNYLHAYAPPHICTSSPGVRAGKLFNQEDGHVNHVNNKEVVSGLLIDAIETQ
jgi:hypothetical protein